MADKIFVPIHDTAARILDFNIYELIEGQTFFATDINKFFVDKGGHRRVQANFESIEIFDGEINEFFERGIEDFYGEIVIANSSRGFKLYYIDTTGEPHLLTYTGEELIKTTETIVSNGLNTFVLNFYKLTDKADNLISTITPPTLDHAIYNFENGQFIELDYTDDEIWTTDLSDLDGEWEWDSVNEEWLFNASALPESIDAENVKIVVSKVLLISRNIVGTFNNIQGDTPSKYREDGINTVNLILYRKTDDTDAPTVMPGELVYKFREREFKDNTNLNGWSLEPPEATEETKVVWYIATVVASHINLAVVSAAEWSSPDIFVFLAEDALLHDITVSSQVITKDSDSYTEDGAFDTFTFSGKKIIGQTLIEPFGALRYKKSDSVVWENFTPSGVEPEKLLTFNEDEQFQYIEIELYRNETDRNSESNRLDYHKIPVVLTGSDAFVPFLTNDHQQVNIAKTGTRSPSNLGTNIQVFKGGVDNTNNWSFVVLDSSGVSPVPTMSNNQLLFSSSSVTASGYVDVKGTKGTYEVVKRFSFGLTEDGADGDPSTVPGPTGPTAVFKGTWASGETYIFSGQQVDVVFYDTKYYILENVPGNNTTDPAVATWWKVFDFFQYIASELSITEESIVRNTITIGKEQDIIISAIDDEPAYLSIGQNIRGYSEDGIFIGMHESQSSYIPTLSLNGANGYLEWSGSSLNIKGDLNLVNVVPSFSISSPFSITITNVELEYNGIIPPDVDEFTITYSTIVGGKITIFGNDASQSVQVQQSAFMLEGNYLYRIGDPTDITLIGSDRTLKFTIQTGYLLSGSWDNSTISVKNSKNLFDIAKSLSRQASGGALGVLSVNGQVGDVELDLGQDPGGSNTQIQFNDNGSFGGSSNLTWNSSSLIIGGSLVLGAANNKATITYPTDTAITLTIPNTGENADFVMSAGNQTISGIKTFSNDINATRLTGLNAPTVDSDAARKKYVDDRTSPADETTFGTIKVWEANGTLYISNE